MAMNAVSKEWWRDPRCHFGELTIDSPRLHQRDNMQPAIEFICTELVLPTRARILDLCCGPARYAVELAHRGYGAVGLDINERYIALARQLAEREGVQATFLTGDMREIPFESHFDAIINLGTSFGFFDSEVENRRVSEEVAKALKPQGVFLLEMGNRDYYLKNFGEKDWRRLENDQVIIIRRQFDYVRSRINVVFEMLGGEGTERWSHSWRAYTLAEVVEMLKQAGLALSCVYGGWERSEYSVDSPRMVIVTNGCGAGEGRERTHDRMLRKIIVGLIPGIIVGGILALVTSGRLIKTEIGAMQTTVNSWTHTMKCGAIDNGILLKAACAMVLPAANLPAEAVYWTAKVDGAGNALSGQHNYILHFPPSGTPPNDAFWSLTMMNAQYLLVANPINRYSVGNLSGLAANADGSIDIYIQNAAPAGHETNWLPAPAGDFILMLRAYQPGPSVLNDEYQVPPVQEVQ